LTGYMKGGLCLVIHKVKRMLSDIISVDPEDIASRMALTRENGVNPIDVSCLIIACEKEFGIIIHDEDVLTFGRVADLAAHIDQMISDGMNEPAERTEEDRTAWFYE